jgi:hypothetical protein
MVQMAFVAQDIRWDIICDKTVESVTIMVAEVGDDIRADGFLFNLHEDTLFEAILHTFYVLEAVIGIDPMVEDGGQIPSGNIRTMAFYCGQGIVAPDILYAALYFPGSPVDDSVKIHHFPQADNIGILIEEPGYVFLSNYAAGGFQFRTGCGDGAVYSVKYVYNGFPGKAEHFFYPGQA